MQTPVQAGRVPATRYAAAVVTRTIGAKPRPRALILQFPDDVAARIAELFPTSRSIARASEVQVRLDEWDVVVIRRGGYEYGLPRHLYVIGFGTAKLGEPDETSSSGFIYIVGHEGNTLAQEFQIGPDLHPDVHALVERDLIPLAQGQKENLVITRSHGDSWSVVRPATEPWIKPFLLTTEPSVLAGAIRRLGAQAEAWSLPEVEDPVPWVRAALRVWHELDPSRFPFDPGWPSEPRWMTNREAGLTADIARLQTERQNFIDESEAKQKELEGEFATAADDATHGQRRLLTAQGDDLVDEVLAALSTLGFNVENRDKVNPENARLEDLRITAPGDDPDWIALAEVRGYSNGGAATKDLLRLSRFADLFREETGRAPSRRWYLVNQFTRRDPSTRPPVFVTSPEELAVFESQNGMVLDTSHLFLLVKGVEAGRIDRDASRRELMKASGRFNYEPA